MNWISVKDRLPENSHDVLVYTIGGYYFISAYFFGFSDFIYPTERSKEYKITHWMPLPEPPSQ